MVFKKNNIPWNTGLKYKRTDEWKINHPNPKKGIKLSELQKNNLSNLFAGVGNPFFGKHHSEETRKKMSISKIGYITWNRGISGYKTKPCSEERKLKIKLKNIGKKRSIVSRKQMSESQQKRFKNKKNHPNFGKHLSMVTKKKISIKNKGKKLSNETRRKISLSSMGRKWNELSKQKMREKRRHWKIPMSDTKPERMMQIALALNGIKFTKHKSFKIGKSWHQVDIFIEPNICVEVDGVHWHIDYPDIKRDLFQTQELTIMGYHVIRIRDKDIVKNTQNCAEKVIRLINDLREGIRLI